MRISEDVATNQRHTHQSKETEPLLPHPILTPAPTQESRSELFGYFLMAISSLGLSGMSLLVHISTKKYNMQATSCFFLRAIIQTFLSYLYLLSTLDIRRLLTSLTSRQWKLLVFRGCIGSLGMACLFAALKRLPVGDAMAIFFMSPIITMLLSSLVLAEPITLIDTVASVVSFTGVVIIAQPVADPQFLSDGHRLVGVFCALAAAFFSACAYVTVRHLGRTVHFMVNVFSLGFASLFTSVFLGGATSPAEMLQNKEGTVLAGLAALFAFVGQSCLNLGLQYCPAGPGVLVRNMDVPTTYVLGLVFMGEHPSWLTSTGSFMVLVATLSIGLRKLMR